MNTTATLRRQFRLAVIRLNREPKRSWYERRNNGDVFPVTTWKEKGMAERRAKKKAQH